MEATFCLILAHSRCECVHLIVGAVCQAGLNVDEAIALLLDGAIEDSDPELQQHGNVSCSNPG